MLKIYQLRKSQNSFEVTLKYKGVGVKVTFVDGNTYNDIPAKCYTSDPFKQRAIENSQMFKNREIVLERTVEDKSDRKAATPRTVKVERKVAVRQQAAKPEPVKAPDTPKVPEDPAEGDGSAAMTFDNLGEAIQYIAKTWQIQVQKESEARKVLKEHGINPTIKKG